MYSGENEIDRLLERTRLEMYAETNGIDILLAQQKERMETIDETVDEEKEEDIRFPPKVTQLTPNRER